MKLWKKEFFFQSSQLNPKKWCLREDIERIEKVLRDYFGEEFFNESRSNIKLDSDTHLLIWLLGQQTKTSLTSLFEYVHLLDYSSKLDKEIQRKLKSNIKDGEQFQNIMFEIYTYRLLDFNKIPNEKGTKKGNQELEGHCTINDKRFLYECRKSYSASKSIFKDIMDIWDSLYLNMKKAKKGNELIGYINIKEFCGKTKEELRQIFRQYFGQFGNRHRVIETEFECEHLKFETKIYNDSNLADYHLKSDDNLIKFRCYIAKENVKEGMNFYRSEIIPYVSIKQGKITDKLIKTIRKKRYQHKASKDENRIIFIDCEITNYLKLPLLMDEQMINEERIQTYVESKETNDIIVIILRNYLSVESKIVFKVFGKKEFNAEMEKLRNLRADFSFKLKKTA